MYHFSQTKYPHILNTYHIERSPSHLHTQLTMWQEAHCDEAKHAHLHGHEALSIETKI